MTEESTELGLEGLKKEYNVFKEKYSLPEFSELNEVFEIEDIENCETEFLLRKVRKVVSEKVAGYLRFTEIILNPSNAPMFFFKLIKKLDEDDKKILNEIYEELGKFEIELVKLDLEYSEVGEADFIKKIFNRFNEMKRDLLKVIDKMGNGVGGKVKVDSGSYFG
jgi:hypothetical protein